MTSDGGDWFVVALLTVALAVAGCRGQDAAAAAAAVVVDTVIEPNATTMTSTSGPPVVSRPPSAAVYLPSRPAPEPADPCKAGNFAAL